MSRRILLTGATSALTALLASRRVPATEPPPDAKTERLARSSAPERRQWQALDTSIKSGWEADTAHALEQQLRADERGTLLFLPFPYIGPTLPGQIFGYMFGWDTDFINRALLVHGLHRQVRHHIANYLFMIDRYGYMPNANVTNLTTRSQTPLIADTLWRYYESTKDLDLLYEAYPRLKRNYRDYWCAAHHQTPVGLATNRDLGDRYLAPELAAEAETGLDWTPIYGGDVRRCVPLITNCALVRYARRLARIAAEVRRAGESSLFEHEAQERSARIRQYCWNDEAGFFFEYDYVAARQLPYVSDCAYWTLWSGVATPAQGRRLLGNLERLEQPFGLSCTDQAYPLPLPASAYGLPCFVEPEGKYVPSRTTAIIGGSDQLQWMYPAGWAPSNLIAIEGLAAYGYHADAQRIASKFLKVLLEQHEKTGQLWEKYNVVDGSVVLPNARCGNIWMRGWTAAAVALLGRYVFENQSLQVI